MKEKYTFVKELEIVEKVKKYLEKRGWSILTRTKIRGRYPDIVALKNSKILVVESKGELGNIVTGVGQTIHYSTGANYAYLALPKSMINKSIVDALKGVRIGLFEVDNKVTEILKPLEREPLKSVYRRVLKQPVEVKERKRILINNLLTKTQLKIMEIFVSKINERFSIKQISEIIKKPYPLVHRSIKLLIDNSFITKDKQNFLSLNYKENNLELAYIESLRKRDFLNNNKTIALFVKDVLEKINIDYFTFLIFGSCVKSKKKPRDVDIIFIIEDKNKINNVEKVLYNIASNLSLTFDINVISVESVYEMLAKRDKINIMNETLDSHILIFGAENYYRFLKNAR